MSLLDKKELLKARKMKKNWKDLNNNDHQLLEKRVLKEQLKNFKKIYIAFPRPVVINNVYIGDDFYKRIQINEAFLYAEEDVPPNCFMMPKTYKTSILKYYPSKNNAVMMVRRRKETEIPSEDIKFEIYYGKYLINNVCKESNPKTPKLWFEKEN